MQLIRKEKLTPHQAHELVKMGFVLKLVKFLCREWDEYEVYVR